MTDLRRRFTRCLIHWCFVALCLGNVLIFTGGVKW